jgi:CheY-like chemotaxis protein
MIGKTILLAEDDPVTQQALAAQLRGAGFQVLTAVDAMQAGMIAQRSAPDAVVLDIQIPGGTGIEALKRMRASSKTQLIPVIAISGSATPDQVEQARLLGATEFLTKPIDFPRLQELLGRLLAEH